MNKIENKVVKEQNRYSVSLVYIKNALNGNEIALRVLITNSENGNEALGKTINEFSEEMKNYNLSLKVIIKIN